MCPNDCGDRIHAGDEVEYDGDVLVHVHCAPAPDPLTVGPRELVCPDCWMVYPANAGHECM